MYPHKSWESCTTRNLTTDRPKSPSLEINSALLQVNWDYSQNHSLLKVIPYKIIVRTVEKQVVTMDMMTHSVEGATRTKDTNLESEPMTVHTVAGIAAEAHSNNSSSNNSRTNEASEDDVLHDLRDSFARTASLSKRPALRRKNSGSQTRSRPMAPRRAQSMHAGQVRSVGRSRSSDGCDLSTMPTLLNQGNPRSTLQRPNAPPRTNSNSKSFQRAKPVRTASDSLRTMRRDQLVNTALERKESTDSLLRGPDDKSVATFSDLDSCFTMDSVTMRKHQLIADPLDDGTYYENDSVAEHDESITHFSEHLPEMTSGEGESIATFCTLDSLRLRRLQIHDVLDQACDVSFFSNSFSTLNTADLDLDMSVMDEEEGFEGLCELDEHGESKLCDLGESGLCELNESQASVACVSVEANVEPVAYVSGEANVGLE
jgi:hypothetical protein